MDTYKKAPIPLKLRSEMDTHTDAVKEQGRKAATTIDLGVADFLRNLSDPMPKIYSYALAREPGTTILTVLLKVSPEELERITKGGDREDDA